MAGRSRVTVQELATALLDGDPRTQERTVRELAGREESRATMVLYDFVREESADPDARHAAAEVLVRRGLLRRERRGPSPMFIWLAALTAVIVVAGAASTVGPGAAAAFGAGALGLGLFALRRRGETQAEPVYIGPHGERIRLARDRAPV